MFVAFAGGVGGARMARGLADTLGPEQIVFVVNTADDFVHHGLCISPDVDTVMYHLAGIANEGTGWGLSGETWAAMKALTRYTGSEWFQLGDQDLATHVLRTAWLGRGEALSTVTARLCTALGVRHRVIPMSDDRVETFVETDEGLLPFQDYFVRRKCEPAARKLRFRGAETARPNPEFERVFEDERLLGIIFCPSNPFLSIEPILSLPGIRQRLLRRKVPAIAISPIIDGSAVKGPLAKLMREWGIQPSALAIARHYRALTDGFVLDTRDRRLRGSIESLGMRVLTTNTLMKEPGVCREMARAAVSFLNSLEVRR